MADDECLAIDIVGQTGEWSKTKYEHVIQCTLADKKKPCATTGEECILKLTLWNGSRWTAKCECASATAPKPTKKLPVVLKGDKQINDEIKKRWKDSKANVQVDNSTGPCQVDLYSVPDPNQPTALPVYVVCTLKKSDEPCDGGKVCLPGYYLESDQVTLHLRCFCGPKPPPPK